MIKLPNALFYHIDVVPGIHQVLKVSWFNGNRTILPFMINHHERREVHAKEASQLQP